MTVFLWIAAVAAVLALGWLLFAANRRAFAWSAPPVGADETRAGVTRTTILVPTASGARIEAWLYRPAGPPRPVIVMAPGLAGTKEGPLERFAWAFAEAGFAAVAFDFRSFGGSEGLPRHDIDPRAAVADWQAVIDHVRTGQVAGVDPARIILWGTSFSGASAICAAADAALPVAGVILHVPYLGVPAKGPGLIQMIGYVALVMAEPVGDAIARLFGIRLNPVYIAAYGKPGEGAFGPSRDCPSRRDGVSAHPFWKLLPASLRGGWKNLIRVRSLASLDSIDPVRALKEARCPVLVVAAIRDDMIDIAGTRDVCAGGGNVELVEIDVGHFDPYVDPHFAPNMARQLGFIETVAGRTLPRRELEATGAAP